MAAARLEPVKFAGKIFPVRLSSGLQAAEKCMEDYAITRSILDSLVDFCEKYFYNSARYQLKCPIKSAQNTLGGKYGSKHFCLLLWKLLKT